MKARFLQSGNGKIEQVHREYKSVDNDTLIFMERNLHMEKIFCENDRKFEEMKRIYDLEDCGMSGLYPEYHWYQDANANVAVYRRC